VNGAITDQTDAEASPASQASTPAHVPSSKAVPRRGASARSADQGRASGNHVPATASADAIQAPIQGLAGSPPLPKTLRVVSRSAPYDSAWAASQNHSVRRRGGSTASSSGACSAARSCGPISARVAAATTSAIVAASPR
jgi:hypothetical protein